MTRHQSPIVLKLQINWKGDIDENGGDLDFSLDTLSLKGFDLEYYDAALGGDIAKMNPFEPNIESLSAKNFSIKVDGLNLDMPKLDAWYSEKKNGKFSTYTTMPSFKMTFDSEPDDKDIKEMKEALSKLGYGEVEFSMNSEGHMDETRDFVDLEKFDLTMKDGFSLTMDYEMTGVKKMTQAFAQFGDPLTGVSANTPPPDMEKLFKEAFTDLKLHHFEIGFDDKSILEKAFNFAAKEQGVGVDLIRQQAKGGVMMATIAVKSEYQSELAADFAENMTKLVDEGGSFKMVMKPDENLNIGQVLEDYTKNEEARMKSIMGQIDDETDTEIIAPEPFDTDAVLRRLGIDFQHSAN